MSESATAPPNVPLVEQIAALSVQEQSDIVDAQPAPAKADTATKTQETPLVTAPPTNAEQPQAPTMTAATLATVPEPTAAPSIPQAQIAEATTTTEATPVVVTPRAAPAPVPVLPTATAPAPTQTPAPFTSTDSDDDEPQNLLTSFFTRAEWAALKELRANLPDLFASAYPDRPNAKTTPIKLWGITLDPTGATKDARASVVLMKFLRARNLNPRVAGDMLVSTLRWRETFNIEAALTEEFPQDVFGPLAHTAGMDKENRPVVYNLYGANPDIKSVFSDVQRFLRWRIALQERSVRQLDFNEVDQMIQIHDYEGVSLSSRDANSKAAASEATSIFAAHYPELLYRKFFVNVPTLMTWIFWAFKPLIPSATLAKMSVVGSGQSAIQKALGLYISDENLPRRYGGGSDAF